MKIEELYKIYLLHPNVQTDTRKLKSGDIYFALKGANFDGNQFAESALKQGAVYSVIDDEKYSHIENTILVQDVLLTLQELATHHRKQFNIPFIAITGSNGKTTTKELIYAVLSSTYQTYATEGNLNNHIGIPLTLLKIKQDAQMAIIEMGANHQQEIASYCKMALPTYGLINNCGKAHLEGFGGEEGVKKGKGELYDYLRNCDGTIFINNDLEYLIEMAQGIQKQISYGQHQAQYIGKIYENNPFLQIAVINKKLETIIHTNLVGNYNFPNVMAAVAIGNTFHIPIEKIKKSIEQYQPDNSRSQLIRQGTNTIILDAYNANPSSMSLAIKNFAFADFLNKVVILGAMMELGKTSIEEHQNIVDILEQFHWNYVVLVGGGFLHTKHQYLYFENAIEASKWYHAQNFQHTAILIKGSRSFTMEKVLVNI